MSDTPSGLSDLFREILYSSPPAPPVKLTLLNRPLFTDMQWIELHGVRFRVVEVSATRVVLAAHDDPALETWREADKLKDRLRSLDKLAETIKSNTHLTEVQKAKAIIGHAKRLLAEYVGEKPATAPD